MLRFTVPTLCLSLTACSDPLNGTNYYGEALLQMSGEVISDGAVGEQDGEIRIALLWSPPGEVSVASDDGVELETATIINWSMTLYHPPDSELYQPNTGEDFKSAIGFPILYLDTDSSGTWNEEWILGGSSTAFVLFIDGEFPAPPDDVPSDSILPEAGYNVVQPPDCEATGPTPPFPTLTPPDQVNLEIGDYFFNNRPDTDCDGSFEEWDALCAYGCGVPE